MEGWVLSKVRLGERRSSQQLEAYQAAELLHLLRHRHDRPDHRQAERRFLAADPRFVITSLVVDVDDMCNVLCEQLVRVRDACDEHSSYTLFEDTMTN